MTKLTYLLAIIIFLFSCNSSKNISDTNNSKSDNNEPLSETIKINTQSRDAQLIELGIDFIAFGNNPSWILKIDFDKRIAQFEQFQGKSTTFELTNKNNNIEAAEFFNDNVMLNVNIEETSCYDINTGEGFNYLLNVEIDGEKLEGFGKYMDEEDNTPSINPIIFGKWNLIELGSTTLENINGVSIILLSSNRLSGNTGCNNYFGSYNISNNYINLKTSGATKMYCKNNIEKEFAMAQKKVTNYIINDNILLLYNKDNKLEMKFSKSKEK